MNKVLCLIFAVFLSIITLHPGRTDENGGHYDTDSGEYHYHHGYPAHQHTNGICPYDFDDRTGENSGGSSGNGSISRSPLEQSKDNKRSIWEILETVFLVFVGIYSVYRIVWFFFVQPRLEEKVHKERNRIKYIDHVKNKPKAQLQSSKRLTPEQQQIFHAMMEIVEKKATTTDCINSVPFILATAYSLVKIPIDPNADTETMARRVLSRACYSVLAYRERNKIPDDGENLSNYTLFELMRDSLLWLLHSKYYSVTRYDSIVKKINPVLIRLNLKRPIIQKPYNKQ